MSLITACPACQTQFEVTDAQLQAYAGKVRCGECDHVFDARSHLIAATAAATVELSAPDHAPSLSHPVVDLDAGDATAHVAGSSDLSLADVRPDWTIQADDQTAHVIPAFLRDVSLDDERPQTHQPPSNTWAYPLLSVLMLLLLALQTVVFSRTALAASYPQIKPLLQVLCRPLHCTLGLPRDISQLTIDDADIQEHKQRQGVLVFSSVLMNHGDIVQAYPVIELTLTNMADEPVLRKTLTPDVYLPQSVNAEHGLAALQEQAVKVLLGVDEKLVTGFRVAIAYPVSE